MSDMGVEVKESNTVVVEVANVSKIFKLFSRQADRLREAFNFFGNKRYHHPFHALENVSLSINKGDTVGIVGRNGSGKSTLLQVVCGILQPTSGTVQVAGRISALLELGAGFNPEFSGRENVYLNASILGVSRQEIDDCFDEIAAFADIGEFIEQPVKSYSSGMYVRLAFAVAINVKPDILIVDEALSVGDALFQAKCFAKFREFQEKGVTIIFVTHSMDLVARYCKTALLLEKGKVVNYGLAKDIVDEYNRIIVGGTEKDGVRTGAKDVQEAEDDRKKSEIGEGSPEEQINSKSLLDYSGQIPGTPVAFQRNHNENRYGNGDAEIIDIGINALSKNEQHSFVHGERYRFWMKVQFARDLEQPIFAYTIKDVKGFDITGTNTYYQEIDTGAVIKGEIVLVEFDQRMMLNAGSYIISFGCAGFLNGEYVVYDRRYDVVSFEVISRRESVGMFDLDSEIRVQRVHA